MRCLRSSRFNVVVPRPVNRLLLSIAALALAAVFAVTGSAQSASTGTIRGRVQNATNGAYLENVTIDVNGTGRQVLTDAYGHYVISNVPAGDVTLRANYTGETEQTATVTVTPGQETAHDFVFRQTDGVTRTEDGAIILDPFVINAERYRNARAIATAEERLSINIKNVVSVDEFGYIPSGNVGEFVKFLPGVQIDYGAPSGSNQGYTENSANAVSVRGFGPEDTEILVDGMPISSTVPGNLTRQVGLDQLSINNASRVELIKVPTPDMPANSVGGQINLITKNAFEYAKPTYSGRVFFNFNSLNTDLKKSPGPTNKDIFKTTPGIDFTVTYPFSDKLGVSFTAYWAQEYSQTYRGAPVWNNNQAANYRNGSFTNTAGVKSSIENPVLTRVQITDQGDFIERRSGNIKVDWRPTPNQLLRANVQYSTYNAEEAQRRLDFRPTIRPTGVQWNETAIVGAAANSTTAMTVTTRDRTGETISAQAQYEIDIAGFKIYAGGNISKSESEYQDEENGHFSEIAMNLNPGRVALYGLRQGLPQRVETFTRGANPQPVDYTQLSNWVFDGTNAKSGQALNEQTKSLYKLDIERPLDFLPFLGTNSLSFKAGFRHDEEKNVKSGRGSNYRQILRPGASYTPADILDDHYVGQSPGFGLPAQQWGSTYKLYALNQEQDIFYVPDFDEPTNTRVENYNSFVGQQKDLKESIDGAYGQLSGSFFNNRLSFVAGARQETRSRVGRSPFSDSKWDFLKNTDGSVYTDSEFPGGVLMSQGNGEVVNGVLVRAPTNRPLFADNAQGIALRERLTAAGISFPSIPFGHPTSGTRSLESRMMQYQPLRAVNQKAKGKPSYSFSSVYRLTKKIDLKAAYSRTFKLPKLESGAAGGIISGTSNFSINEFTETETQNSEGALGEIVVANPGIKPETSNNIDVEVSYHTDSGGKLSVAYWVKDITDQIQNYTTYSGTPTFNVILDSLGLDPDSYVDWRTVTSTNAATKANPSGWEFEARQDLSFLGSWGRRVSGFVTYAIQDEGDPITPIPYTVTHPNGTTVEIVPNVVVRDIRANKFGGAGIQYAGKRFVAQIRGVYKNESQDPNFGTIDLGNGNYLRRIYPEETRIDVNLSYVLNKNFSLFLSGRDVFNGERDVEWRDDKGELVPGHARLHDRKYFGVSWTVGVAARF